MSVALMVMANVSAQRVAVLDFNAGTGVSQADVDGISAIFNTYFSPKGYTLVERTSIDRVIDEQDFQRSKMTQSQMVRVGELLNVAKVVIGDVNLVMGQYNIDVRVVNVESGTILAKDGATWSSGSSYRTMMSGLASRLANQIAITPTQSTISNSEYVDLGLPSGTLWKTKNEKGFYYTWEEAVDHFGDKLPSKQHFLELKAFCDWTWNGNGYLIIGSNGNSIELPATGMGQINEYVGEVGFYWTSTRPTDLEDAVAYAMCFTKDEISSLNGICSTDCQLSVRLIK